MVTKDQYNYNGAYMSTETFYGLSTDTKPTTCGNGSIFIAVDKIDSLTDPSAFMFDAENGVWYPVPESDNSDDNGEIDNSDDSGEGD